MLGIIRKTKAAAILLKALERISLNSYILPYTYTTYGYNNAFKQISAYCEIDDLYSIVNKIDGLCKTIPLYSYEEKNAKAADQYKLIARKMKQSKNYSPKAINDLQEIKYKAYELAGENDALQKILDRPNEYESRDDFYSAIYTFPLLTGNSYTVIDKYQDGASKGRPSQLYNISPAYINIVPAAALPRRVDKYQYTLYLTNIFYEAADVMHRRYFNPNYDYAANELYGLSPLQSAIKLLSQIANERDYANRALKNSGAFGFINNEDADFDIETFGSVKEDILKELGAVRSGNTNINARKLGLLLGKWKYNQIGISPVDMNLSEQGKISFKKLCNIYGISDRLFNNDATGSEISIDKMLRDAFISVAIPEVAAVRDLFNNQLAPLYKDKKRFVDYDISDITQLQEDINAVIDRFAASPAFRVSDLFEATGFGKIDDPNADVILVKTGYAPLSDVANPFEASYEELNKNNLNDYAKNGNGRVKV